MVLGTHRIPQELLVSRPTIRQRNKPPSRHPQVEARPGMTLAPPFDELAQAVRTANPTQAGGPIADDQPMQTELLRVRAESPGARSWNRHHRHDRCAHDATQYANNRVEADHGRLKAGLRPMRGLKRDRTASVVIRGHAFIQNLRRGHYELGQHASGIIIAAAFDELGRVVLAANIARTRQSAAMRSINATEPARFVLRLGRVHRPLQRPPSAPGPGTTLPARDGLTAADR